MDAVLRLLSTEFITILKALGLGNPYDYLFLQSLHTFLKL